MVKTHTGVCEHSLTSVTVLVLKKKKSFNDGKLPALFHLFLSFFYFCKIENIIEYEVRINMYL